LVALLSVADLARGAPGDGDGDAIAAARSNAQTALALALGELQKSAGPDQRITARADILDANIAQARLTGVWDSWEIKATAPPLPADYERPAKDAKFRGWLVSDPNPEAVRQVAFANQALGSPATLWGNGTLGNAAPANSFVRANKVPVDSPLGTYAWAVLDEGVKVRINTPYADGATSAAAKTLQLGSGERPGTEFIPRLGALRRRFFAAAAPEFADFVKGIGDTNFGLTAERLAPGTGEVLKSLTHDVTLHSMGLFTDTARGGLKQDFHLLTNTTSLPAAYSGKGVYASRLGMTPTNAPSDPRWESLQQYSRLYRDKLISSTGVPVIKAQVPSGWAAATTSTAVPPVTTLNRTPPPGVVLLPTLAKVQMLFSLIGRDLYSYTPPAGNTIPADAPPIHNPQASYFRGTKYQYDLHLLYTPIVTLHNPYNVALEFTALRVEFVHVPFAMQLFRNGVAQSTGLVPFETMYIDNQNGQTGKIFGMNLKAKTNGVPGSTTLRLLPGEVKVFSPYLDPSRTYLQELSGDRTFFDYSIETGITTNINAIPGWRGDGVGFDCDWLTGAQPVDGIAANGHWQSGLGLAADDQIHVVFAPLGIPLSNHKFTIKMSATLGTSATLASAIEMDYESPTGLQDSLIGKGGTLRYPKTGTVRGSDLVDHATTPLKNIMKSKPFAVLSVQGKSTSGARTVGNEDGRLATKPWCFAHANIAASPQKVITEHSANGSHEFDLQRLDNGTSNLVQTDAQDRGYFISGQSAVNGTRFGAQYDIPLAPLQSLASLNGANPGGASGYLPRFAQPIGNSWAHPLLTTSKLSEAKSGGDYLDHSFLLNLALYDGFYFSGLASQAGPFGSGRSSTTIAAEFAAGTALDDPRLMLHRPDARLASALTGEVARSDAYARIAAWQLMKGSFNINSTSVLAWKAMLASIHDSQALVNQLNKSAGSSSLTILTATAGNEARISRFRLPVAVSAADGADPKDAYWLGPREFSDAELQTLAENIVKQVRLRGPFLSLAEFVNRRLGANDASTQRGPLQQAIDESNLNPALATAAGAGFEISASAVTTYNYINATAGVGPSYQGAPGFLTQADLLNLLGNAAAPRSDTFTIRGYGEAHDATGKITASATCEAVVQRLPDWVDPADQAETAPASLASLSNKTLGRRFRLLAFRWLSPDEI
jgi:hypothetical protein